MQVNFYIPLQYQYTFILSSLHPKLTVPLSGYPLLERLHCSLMLIVRYLTGYLNLLLVMLIIYTIHSLYYILCIILMTVIACVLSYLFLLFHIRLGYNQYWRHKCSCSFFRRFRWPTGK
jgi:hypothetical protein